MSMFEDSRYRWRETCFVLFDAKNRPKLTSVTHALGRLNKRFQLSNLNADSHGQIESLTLVSPDDYAALDICYTDGAEVLEQGAAMVDDLRKAGADNPPPVPWEQIKQYDGRFDLLHFEQVPEDVEEGAEEEGMLDPSALLAVMGALAKLTDGVAIDPQAGTFLCEE
jgi:hypothetical protein